MRILVVEDEHRISASLKKGLEQEKYAVDVCYDGEEGFGLASSEEYDLIILDLMLPKKDGLSVCRDLRRDDIHTPILMLTAKSQIEDKITGLDSGADDYLSKPFAFEELLSRVRALLRRPKKTLDTKLEVDGLSLDTIEFEVERDNKQVALSSKEFALLQYLMRNKGRILTKEQIISHVWNFDSDVLPNTVEVNIRNLRNKIDRPFKNLKPLISTVRGFGYMIGHKNV